MQYRNFGRLDWKASALGFGCMRFPTADGNRMSPNIVQEEATRMLRRAIDEGVNYVDTAYLYHAGASETAVGVALRDGYRERVKLATKMPVWMAKEAGDFDRILDEQLKRLETDHIDFYLLHALGHDRWHDCVLKLKMLESAERAKADGRIRHIGFSFHDGFEAFEEILTGYDKWDFCQIQLNYMDIMNQAGVAGLKMAAERGLAVVIMEPLMGGRLADPPTVIREVVEQHPVRKTPAAWALEWLWNQPEVSVILSGMSTMEQVEENLATASGAKTGAFSEADEEFIGRLRTMYQERMKIPCSKCSYCMPCPNGVNIPNNFEHFNYAYLYDDMAGAKFRYNVFLTEEQRAGACIECGICAELCPQQIAIPERLHEVAELLGAAS